jgi:hypothetical protein
MADPETEHRRVDLEEEQEQERARAREREMGWVVTEDGMGVLTDLSVTVLDDVLVRLPRDELAFVRAASRFLKAMADWSWTRRMRPFADTLSDMTDLPRARRRKVWLRCTALKKTWKAAVRSRARIAEALAAAPPGGLVDKEGPCAAAARLGSVEVVEWLHAQGYPLDKRAALNSTERRGMDLLQWLRAHGCPWNVWICVTLSDARHPGGREWVHLGAKHDWPCAKYPCAYAREHRADAL